VLFGRHCARKPYTYAKVSKNKEKRANLAHKIVYLAELLGLQVGDTGVKETA